MCSSFEEKVGESRFETPSSNELMTKEFGWTRQKMFDMATEATAYAKDHGLHKTYFAVDSTRADPALLGKMYTAVVKKSHVESVVVVDTFGITTAQGMAEMVHSQEMSACALGSSLPK